MRKNEEEARTKKPNECMSDNYLDRIAPNLKKIGLDMIHHFKRTHIVHRRN